MTLCDDHLYFDKHIKIYFAEIYICSLFTSFNLPSCVQVPSCVLQSTCTVIYILLRPIFSLFSLKIVFILTIIFLLWSGNRQVALFDISILNWDWNFNFVLNFQMPAAFGLVSFLLHEGFERNRIRKHLLVFALAAPVLAVFTYVILSQVRIIIWFISMSSPIHGAFLGVEYIHV